MRSHDLVALTLAWLVPLLVISGCQTPPRAAADATHLNQTRLAAALQIADERINAGRFTEARRDLARFSNSRDVRLAMTLARIDLEEGEYAAALGRLDVQRGAGDTSAVYHRLRGIALEGLGRWEDATGAYQKSWELDPSPEVLSAWVDALVLGGHPEAARDVLQRARASAPGHPALQVMAARLGSGADELVDSARELETAALADPGAREIRERLAAAYAAAGRHGPAAALWRDLASNAKEPAERLRLQRRCAASLASAGELEEARGIYGALVSAQPEDTGTRLALAAVCLAAGHTAEALEAAQVVLQVAPDNVDARVLAALAHRRLNDTSAAVDALTDARVTADQQERVRPLLLRWR